MRDEPDDRGAVLSRDTSAAAERAQVEAWRRMSSVERARLITGACRAARALAYAGLRSRYPRASDHELLVRYAALTLGVPLARQVYPELDQFAL